MKTKLQYGKYIFLRIVSIVVSPSSSFWLHLFRFIFRSWWCRLL